MKKRLLNLMKLRTAMMLATVVVTFLGLPTKAWADSSGTCGKTSSDNVTWSYVESTKTLTVSGTGAMADYDRCPFAPPIRSNATTIIIGSGVTSVGNHAFDAFSVLASITIASSVTVIGDYAFNYYGSTATNLEVSFEEGSELTKIGDYAFNSCRGMTNFAIPAGVTSIGSYAFFSCSGLSSISIPGSVTSIGESAFKSCGLTSIQFSEGLQTIGKDAFFLNDDATIEIPSTVTFIGDMAFTNHLSYITILAKTPPTLGSWNAFGTDHIYVPYSSLDSYKTKYCDFDESRFKVFYSITIDPSMAGTALGTLTADKAYVKEDASEEERIVTLTPTPATGYAVGTVSYLDDQYQLISIIEPDNGVYSITMPAKDVIATASFKKLLTHEDITIAAIDDQTYTGSELKPTVTVLDGEEDITGQCDITYSGNTDVGTATVTIKAKAESIYAGETSTTFTIKLVPVDLKVTNTVVSTLAADANMNFDFTVTLDDATIAGSYGDMTFIDGVATFSLKNGEYATADGLAEGLKYTVTQTAVEGFDTTKEGDTGTISTTLSTAAFTNTREVGDLKVTNTVESAAAEDADKVFTFTVALSNTTINGTFGDMTFVNGVASITLKGGESATATGLPYGIDYTVTQADADKFDITTKVGDMGTISTTLSTAAFTNTREVGSLKVTNTMESSVAADADIEYAFRVTLSNTSINGTFGDMNFTDGVANFSLKGGESATATGLPTGIDYIVLKTDAEGYETTKEGDEGTISTTLSIAAFTNTREGGDLKVTNTVEPSDDTTEFEFTVTLNETSINHTFGGMTFVNGVATFKLKGGESATATGIPTSLDYTVTQKAAEGFETTKEGDEGTISSMLSTAAFVNTKTYTLIGLVFADGMHYATYCNTTDKDLTVPEGLKAYAVTGVNEDEDVVTLAEVGFLPKRDGTSFVALLMYRADLNTSVGTVYEYTGTETAPTTNLRYNLDEKGADDGDFVLYNDEFVKAKGTIPGGTRYLSMGGYAASRLGIGGEATGIFSNGLTRTDSDHDRWYDLQGRRIEKPTKPGLYIKNGQKQVIKTTN